MKKKIYFIQPTYWEMDGSLVKGWTLFNHSLNLSILGGAVPHDWDKEFCLEYFDEVNFDTDASVAVISCMGYDIMHALEISKNLKSKGKVVIYGAHMDNFSEEIMSQVCDSVFYGTPTPDDMAKILQDICMDRLKNKYRDGIFFSNPTVLLLTFYLVRAGSKTTLSKSLLNLFQLTCCDINNYAYKACNYIKHQPSCTE